jgi:hypothetical protein
MSSFNWCHGPNCHTKQIQSRVRGSKGNKVLRTMKVKYQEPRDNYWFRHWWNYFCNQSCLMEFVEHNIQGMIALAPRREALETPINDPERTTTTHTYGMNNEYSYNRVDTKIEKKVS